MDWILFEKCGTDCVCKATTGHENMFCFFFSEEAICRVPSSAYESTFKNPTQFMFSAGLSCTAFRSSAVMRCP